MKKNKRKELDRLSIGINSKWLYILKAETIFISHTFIEMFNRFKYANRIDVHTGRPKILANHMHSTAQVIWIWLSVRFAHQFWFIFLWYRPVGSEGLTQINTAIGQIYASWFVDSSWCVIYAFLVRGTFVHNRHIRRACAFVNVFVSFSHCCAYIRYFAFKLYELRYILL